MRQSSTIPAVLTAMGCILSWTNLRFPGTAPTGFKLLFLFLLVGLWLLQIGMEKFSSHPLGIYRLSLFSAGVAAAFYWFSAVESFRLLCVNCQPAGDWILLVLSLLIACAVTILYTGPQSTYDAHHAISPPWLARRQGRSPH